MVTNMFIKSHNFSNHELDYFRDYQRLSFRILEETAASLQLGKTEKEVARELVLKFRDAGVKSFFHLPVVLFGSRTALPGTWSIGHFFPKSKALSENTSVIMDASPIFNGYMVDTSYSFCFGKNASHAKMMMDLSGFRDAIRDSINNGDSFMSIAHSVNSKLRAMGYDPVHTKHPGEVLGHRAIKVPRLPFTWRTQGFDALSLLWFKLKAKLAGSGWSNNSPLWNGAETSNHKPHDGLWLVEPHAGADKVGAKWEEILVIKNGEAEWLDKEPPHVKQWRNITDGMDYSPAS